MENPKSKIVWPAFLLVTLIAFFFRFYRLAGHPLGLFFDPAINGLDAIRLLERGGPVIFFPTNGGREALLIYLLMPFIWLFGPTPFSFRLQLALISLLNVVFLFAFLADRDVSRITYHVPRVTLHASRFTFSPHLWLATLAGLALAVSYWHLSISRLDQRPLTVPLLAVAVFWFFFKGWAGGRKRWFMLSGLFMGLGLHTYSAARLLPVILLLTLLPELLPTSAKDKTLSPTYPLPPPSRITHHVSRFTFHVSRFTLHLSLLAFTALLVAAPMLWYFLTHPAQFTARAGSVMIWNFLDTPAAILAEIGRNLLRVLGFFCCAGNPNAIFGLPGHPGLSPLLAPLLLIGLIGALAHWRLLFHRLIALWWLIGIMPSIVAIEAPHPLRMIVALPPTAILIALAPFYLITWLKSKAKKQVSRFTFHVSRFRAEGLLWLTLLLILLTIPATFRAYFIDWTKLRVTQGIYDYGAVAIRDTILGRVSDQTPIYLPLDRFNEAPLLYYLSGAFHRRAALTAPPVARALAISPQKNEQDTTWVRLQADTATLLPPLTPAGQQLIRTALTGDSAQPVRTISGETVARLAELPTDPAHFLQQPTQPLTASFEPARLTGLAYSPTIEPGLAQMPVTSFWQANHPMVDEYEILLHLVDDHHRAWGDGSIRPTDWVYPTTFWRPGLDEIAVEHPVSLASETLVPGRYWLAISLFNPATGQRVPLSSGQSDSPDTFFTGPLKVPLPPPLPGEIAQFEPVGQPEIIFGEMIRLAGFKADALTIAPGEPVRFSLLWETLKTPPLDYTVFIHLLDTREEIVAGSDSQPLNGSYPTTIWTAGERILDPRTLPTPASLPPGQYRLAFGLYYQPTGERLPLQFSPSRQDQQGRLILDQPVRVTIKE